MPEIYNEHYINKYAFPRALISYKKADELRKDPNQRKSIYDMRANIERRGISGWKLTKKALQPMPDGQLK
jgi:hypothetical protein